MPILSHFCNTYTILTFSLQHNAAYSRTLHIRYFSPPRIIANDFKVSRHALAPLFLLLVTTGDDASHYHWADTRWPLVSLSFRQFLPSMPARVSDTLVAERGY